MAASAMDQLGLGHARFHRLLQLYRGSPVAASLLPRRRGRERGEQRLPPAAEQLIARGIAECYLTLEKPSGQALRRWPAMRGRSSARRRQAPRRSGRDWTGYLPKRSWHRQGANAIADKWEPTRGVLEADYALELVQSDHTLVDVIVVDDLYRKPIGRPWLTLMMDIASRTVPG